MMNTTASPNPDRATEALRTRLDPTFFRALGDPTRLALLARLATTVGPLTVTELSSCCGVHLSGVSRHLRMLADAGLLEVEKDGREVRYRFDCAAVAGVLRGLADALESCAAACGGASGCCTTNGAPSAQETHHGNDHDPHR